MKCSLLSSFSLFLLFNYSATSYGLKIPFERRVANTDSKFRVLSSTSSSTDASDLGNVMNIRYTTNITINSKVVRVVLDTGSTDLWVVPPGGIGQFNDTGIPLFLGYGDGSYGVNGTIGVAPFEFGKYKVDKQAFLNADSVTIGGMQEIGVYGIFGLSFNFSGGSPINDAIQSTYGPSTTWGSSVVDNIFQQHPEDPNFIGMDLSRTDDLEDSSGGSFTIGEYDPDYKAIAQAPKLPQYPPGSNTWTTLVDGINVNGNAISIQSAISGVPQGKAVALLDSGTPTAYIPGASVDELYGAVSGARKIKLTGDLATQYGGGDKWIVPCNATPTVEFIFGGQAFPIHPLDLTTITQPIEIQGQNYTVCMAAIEDGSAFAGDRFDMLIGDTFLRNTYSIYDFGDLDSTGKTGAPFMQLLSKTDPQKAASDSVTSRAKTLSTLAPELSSSQLASLIESEDSGLSAVGSTRVASSNSSPGTTDSSADTWLSKYGMVIIGLLAGNLLIGLILLILGVLTCVRRGTSRGPSGLRSVGPSYAPVRFKETEAHAGSYHDETSYSQ